MRLSTDDLPMFFDAAHGALADRLRAAAPQIADAERAGDEATCDRAAAAALGRSGMFELVAPADGKTDARSLCLAREMLGYHSPRADSIFAVQGLGVHSILLAGTAEQRAQVGAFARGSSIAAFAVTEPDAGSDVASIQTRAVATASGYQLDGDKLFISNLGIADHATGYASTDPARGAQGLTAFWLPLDTKGVTVKPLAATAPHPIGALELRGVVVPDTARIGDVGQGMKLAMQTLDAFRVSVGAAAVGMARRAMDEALRFVTERVQFGKPLSEQQLVQAHIADMAVDLDTARLLVLRAAHRKDTTTARVTTEVSIAKLGATEA
ncbi:MAG TPA: acyl-CoA dehydrogenase, partial [Kofleriaceae bacterium]